MFAVTLGDDGAGATGAVALKVRVPFGCFTTTWSLALTRWLFIVPLLFRASPVRPVNGVPPTSTLTFVQSAGVVHSISTLDNGRQCICGRRGSLELNDHFCCISGINLNLELPIFGSGWQDHAENEEGNP
jgi:hypothetical protein